MGHRTWPSRALSTALALVAALAAACSEGTDDSTSTTATGGCVDYGDGSLFTGPVSFANDVMPVFQVSCNFGACHSSEAINPQEGLALGPPCGGAFDGACPREPTQSEIDAAHAAVVGVDAVRAAMPLVEPANPAQSFLMVKLEYSDFDACPSLDCGSLGCGVRMPQGASLDAPRLAVVRTWIRDGAANN